MAAHPRRNGSAPSTHGSAPSTQWQRTLDAMAAHPRRNGSAPSTQWQRTLDARQRTSTHGSAPRRTADLYARINPPVKNSIPLESMTWKINPVGDLIQRLCKQF
jgi:hypothetical protein